MRLQLNACTPYYLEHQGFHWFSNLLYILVFHLSSHFNRHFIYPDKLNWWSLPNKPTTWSPHLLLIHLENQVYVQVLCPNHAHFVEYFYRLAVWQKKTLLKKMMSFNVVLLWTSFLASKLGTSTVHLQQAHWIHSRKIASTGRRATTFEKKTHFFKSNHKPELQHLDRKKYWEKRPRRSANWRHKKLEKRCLPAGIVKVNDYMLKFTENHYTRPVEHFPILNAPTTPASAATPPKTHSFPQDASHPLIKATSSNFYSSKISYHLVLTGP